MSPTRTDRDLHDMREAPEREISLGTPTILAIFFALALVCAVFFGLGYTFGRKSVPPSSAPIAEASSNSGSFKALKPAPGNPASSLAANPASSATQHPAAITVPGAEPAIPKKAAFDPDAEIVTTVAPAKPLAAALKPGSPQPQPSASGSAIVQVSAFRRQEDADMVASALRRKGYTVYIRQEPQDNYLHVQLGPYATKKDAEAMRDRLSADGFNAIVK